MEENTHQTLEDLVVLAVVVVVETTLEILADKVVLEEELVVQLEHNHKVVSVVTLLVLAEVAEDGHLDVTEDLEVLV